VPEVRAAARPDLRITYPDLPITERRDDLLAALAAHQVVVVAGETGSGKTTQLPKLLLESGRGSRGLIGHTQPRRIAARAVGARLAEELGTTVGDLVGVTVRFSDQVGERTRVKVMTDGILLAEVAGDPRLRRYDALVVDEAHERSLNIDVLLGYLRRLLPERPDLQLVITSATIDTARFAAHFGGAPVVEVSGRTYPVEIRYRPLDPADEVAEDPAEDEEEPGEQPGRDGRSDDPARPRQRRHEVRDPIDAVVEAVAELAGEGPGDVLVFLSGEREIRDAAEALSGAVGPTTEILPLFARLSAAEQHRVFAPHPGRRIVLATNVAETSLTVPGVRYVVDAGTARISRYSRRTKVQRLPIEPVSQASADQRAGRCGRVAPGICIRLYSEDDFRSRPEYTEPEILRTNLASVVLRLAAWGIGDVADLPFLDPPDRRQVRDAVAVLEELGAVRPQPEGLGTLTGVGRRLARLPVDPRIGRMLLAADGEGCLAEVLVVAAALSIQDPRERPVEGRAQADALHARFADRDSDFLAYLRLWEYLGERRRELGSGAFRRMCRDEHLHYLRVREWQDLHGQLRRAAREVGLTPGSVPAGPAAVHRAVLAGLLSHVGLRDAERGDYQGARGARFLIAPGSSLARRRPRWVVAAELVETTRLWARTVARIEPEWVESLAGHLVAREYSEPHWDRGRGQVLGYERVTLYGVPLVARRRVGYARVDPAVARELFLRHALVEGDWDTRHRFFRANRALLQRAAELEDRVRRRDVVPDDETLLAFYDARVPADVVSARHFDAWWNRARQADPDLLTMRPEHLLPQAGGDDLAIRFPAAWPLPEAEGGDLALEYRFEPGAPDDGVTVVVPLALLDRLPPEPFTWQVPGLREGLVTALLRSLPKALRRSFVPAPTYAAAVLDRLPRQPQGALTDAVAAELRRLGGVGVAAEDFALDKVPAHLRVRFRVVDADGRPLASGRDLAALRDRLRGRLRRAVRDVAADVERTGVTSWGDLVLPREVERAHGGRRLRGWPALVDEGESVAVRVLGSPAEQVWETRRGLRRLLLLEVPSPARGVVARLSTADRLVLASAPYPDVTALLADCVAAAVDRVVQDEGPATDVRDPAAYARLRAAVAARLPGDTAAVLADVERVLRAAGEVRAALSATTSLAVLPSAADARAHLDRLVHPGFVTEAGAGRLRDVARYLRALQRRLEVLPTSPQRDLARLAEVHAVEAEVAAVVERLAPAEREAPAVADLRWQLEELRVSLFAQSVGTARPVSAQRIRAALAGVAVTRPGA
jgi:ATP-dependent helicase HrpA